MHIKEFFDLPAVSLPKTRQQVDFVLYLQEINAAYVNGVDQLLPGCPLGGPIQAARQTIIDLGQQIIQAAGQYLDGRPAAAYDTVQAAIAQVQVVNHLISVEVQPADLPVLFRMTPLSPNELTKGRIFHIPFHLRHLVGRHRYGIPGFPCLYLGGSLRLCQEECEIPYHKLNTAGMAAFRLRLPVRFLDFGYRPSFIGNLAQGRLLNLAEGHQNLALDAFIIDYAICWPLIAACSVRRMHDGKFAPEYVIPHLTLQWVMEQGVCDGIRFFSTKVAPGEEDVVRTINYAFPARLPALNGYSARLRDLFEFTEPVLWRGIGFWNRLQLRFGCCNWRMRVTEQFHENTVYIQNRPMAQM